MGEWAMFQGGELEGERPSMRCTTCRRRHREAAPQSGPLCFQCYRLEFERRRQVMEAAELQAMSAERLQYLLPFEAVDEPRLIMLRARLVAKQNVGGPVLQKAGGPVLGGPVVKGLEDLNAPKKNERKENVREVGPDLIVRRRRAQIAARHALSALAHGVAVSRATGTDGRGSPPLAESNDSVQFPASWIPFLVARQRRG